MESDLVENPSMDTSPSPHRQAVRERACSLSHMSRSTSSRQGLLDVTALNGGSGSLPPRISHVPQPLLPSGHIQGHGSWAAIICSLALTSAAPPAWQSQDPPRSAMQLAGGPESVGLQLH